MNHPELTDLLKEVLRDSQTRLEKAKDHYEELLHKRNAVHSTISILAERGLNRNDHEDY